ncbi:PaaI family thioesterase [Kordiimonas pumila]|uniref:PaaI family thioesterase n=1 Tax=Kordiimonas pumila TaxID=2161677 RepID=A0ABV7D7G3_9PROT|nr:PaaI family thioesterase [Kordiimonas pumila]
MTTEIGKDLTKHGYRVWGDSDPFEDMIGPFYLKENGDGTCKAAFWAEKRHCNGSGPLHGGLLMSFADYALFAIARDQLEGRCVTVGFNSEFVSAGMEGDLIEAKGDIVRATRSLLFVRGEVFTGDRIIMTFSGILKRIKA